VSRSGSTSHPESNCDYLAAVTILVATFHAKPRSVPVVQVNVPYQIALPWNFLNRVVRNTSRNDANTLLVRGAHDWWAAENPERSEDGAEQRYTAKE
jgi:hypothetical protein